MKYLELEDLNIGSTYVCVPYDNANTRMVLTYVGNGEFIDEFAVYTVYGDIRYVLDF